MNSESREEFFTCDSSSTLPHIGYDESLRQSNFDTSFLPPPPPVNGVIGHKPRVATFNIQMDSHMGQIQAFRGDYVINQSIK